MIGRGSEFALFGLHRSRGNRPCQSALKGDPQSASKRDPLVGLDRRCPSALRRRADGSMQSCGVVASGRQLRHQLTPVPPARNPLDHASTPQLCMLPLVKVTPWLIGATGFRPSAGATRLRSGGREFRQASTRLDTPPCSIRHHPDSAIALVGRMVSRSISRTASARSTASAPGSLRENVSDRVR